MDKTFIRDLKVHAIIGVYDFERKHAQPLSFDIEMTSDLTKAGESDDLNYAINYAAVSQDVIDLTKSLKPQLIERLADAVAAMILEKYQPESVTIRISKPDAVAAASAVGVEITRSKNSQR
ncbi:dihydroneopterin aldolase [Litoribrevibacter albus]|uniref:7,8-dihydroneopterin aldolase n=1 Tax=Litoribrevibacter albus TaxID=1473156 RepID=A0AA37SFP6_9GAMM|nr:dihydroneopterin aldolase [Litoribrevibacter albus]GLQ33304.1 7,8-dihydroneopterin aldolase [Litoribrevibacter albus]